MLRTFRFTIITMILILGVVQGFCGFYVSKADADLFNEASKVIIARDGNRTILTMANDFRGDANEFALVVPVPTVLQEGQIQVGNSAIIDRIDAYSAPRLVEYFDENPCYIYEDEMFFDFAAPQSELSTGKSKQDRARSLGVTIEAAFSVGEYDILILSAQESSGLETWLLENDYNIPEGASEIFNRYIKQEMKFFVAKVNLEAFERTGQVFLRPIVMAFESEELMLPIQLGTINADGPQDLVVFLLSPEGRITTSNYRTVNIPSDENLPEFVENDFGKFYKTMFQNGYKREGNDVVFLEYAWDMSWCDPCAADPLSKDELHQAGVFWLEASGDFSAPNVYLTRLHLRYTAQTHPEDLRFEVSDNRENFQGRYILQRPFKGKITCEAGGEYVRSVKERQEQEAKTLANLTGWDITDIRNKIGPYNPEVDAPDWWDKVFE